MRWGGTCTVYEHCHLHLGKGNANGNLDKHEIQMRQKWWDRPSANNPTFWRSKLRGQLPQQRRGAQAPAGQWEHLGRQRQGLSVLHTDIAVGWSSHDASLHMMETTEQGKSLLCDHTGATQAVRPTYTSFFLAYRILSLVSHILCSLVAIWQSLFPVCGLEDD